MVEKKSPPRLESYLRRGMQAMGQVVERAIGKAQEAKQTVVTAAASSGGGGGGGSTIEANLSVPKVKELLRLAADRLIPSLIPALAERRVFEVADGVGHYMSTMKEHGAACLIATEIGAGTAVHVDAMRQQFQVRAVLHRMPFADGIFDFGIANLLTSYQGDILRALKELSRILTAGGTVIVADFHPFGPYAKRGTARVRPTDSAFRGVADYYKAARLAGLKIADVREVFLDEGLRPAFVTPDEKRAYRTLRDVPLVLAMVARKGMT